MAAPQPRRAAGKRKREDARRKSLCFVGISGAEANPDFAAGRSTPLMGPPASRGIQQECASISCYYYRHIGGQDKNWLHPHREFVRAVRLARGFVFGQNHERRSVSAG
jgi:hypothetical protein